MKVMYSAEKGKAWKEECGVRKQIQVRDARPPLVVISRSHGNDPELQEYLEQLGEHQTTSIGSSLKFCLVAEGQAQLYPRFGPTSTGTPRPVMRSPAPPGRTFTTGRGVLLITRRVNRSSTPASGSLFIKQLVQQAHYLLHLLLAERAVFSPLHATLFVQHHDG